MKVTVRTLDSKNQEFTIENEEITVREFKELIHPAVKIDVEKQRIIFKGKVLKDEKQLKEYGVDGLVVHLVEKAPPSSTSTSSTSTSQQGSTFSSSTNSGGSLDGVAQTWVNNLISQFGASNVSTRQSGNSLSVDVNVSQSISSEDDVRRRLGTAERFLSHAEHLLMHIEMSQPSNQLSSEARSNNSSHEETASQISSHGHSHGGLSHGGHSHDDRSLNHSHEHSHSHSHTHSHSHSHSHSHRNNGRAEQPESNESGSDSSSTDPVPQSLANLWRRYIHFNQHFFPSMARYVRLLENPSSQERSTNDDNLPDQIAEIFHDLSHMFHSLSDLTFNFNSPQPQRLMCFPQISPPMGMGMNFPFHGLPVGIIGQPPPPSNSSGVPRPPRAGVRIRQARPVSISSTVVHIPSHRSSFTGANPTSSAASERQAQANSSTTTTNVTTSSSSGSTQSNTNENNQTSSNPYALPSQVRSFMSNLFQNLSGNVTSNNETSTNSSSTSSTFSMPGIQISSSSSLYGPFVMETGSYSGPITSSMSTDTHTSQQHRNEGGSTQPSRSTATQPNQNEERDRHGEGTHSHRPHRHHHYHTASGSVMHPDNLLPCRSFHFGPTFNDFEQQQIPTTQPTTTNNRSSTTSQAENQSSNADTSMNQAENQSSNADTNGLSANSQIPPELSNFLNGILDNLPNDGTHSAEVQVHIEDSSDVDMDIPGLQEDEFFQRFQSTLRESMNSSATRTSATNITHPTRNTNSSQTLRDFMRTNFGITEEGDGSLMSDLMDVIADNLSMPDLLGLFMGNSSMSWSRLHSPLRQLVEKHFNSNRPMTSNQIEEMSLRMSIAFAEFTSEVEGQIEVSPGIDLKATLRNIDKKYFEKFLRYLLQPASLFGENMGDWYREYSAWSIAVLDRVVTGRTDRYFQAMITTLSVQQLMRDLTPEVRQLVVTTLMSRLRQSVSSIEISQEELESTLVRSVDTSKIATSRENPYKGENERAAKRMRRNENLNVNELWEELNSNVPDTFSDDNISDIEGESPPQHESWHSAVPSDWVLTINRDIEKQRQNAPQRPYSDAYLSGLPEKKRQMLTQHSRDGDRINVGASICKSIERTGVKRKTGNDPISENLQADIEESDLQEMFEATFRHDVRQRLQSDADYRDKQFPNAHKYFMSEKE